MARHIFPDANEYERIELSGTIHMCEQEKVGILDYVSILQLMTAGFGKVFGREAVTIALNAYDMIIGRYGGKAGHTPAIIKGEFTYPERNESF